MDVGRNPRSLATVTRAQKGKTGEKGGGRCQVYRYQCLKNDVSTKSDLGEGGCRTQTRVMTIISTTEATGRDKKSDFLN